MVLDLLSKAINRLETKTTIEMGSLDETREPGATLIANVVGKRISSVIHKYR